MYRAARVILIGLAVARSVSGQTSRDSALVAQAVVQQAGADLYDQLPRDSSGVLLRRGQQATPWTDSVFAAIRVKYPESSQPPRDSVHALVFTLETLVFDGSTATVKAVWSRCDPKRKGATNSSSLPIEYRFVRATANDWRFEPSNMASLGDGQCNIRR